VHWWSGMQPAWTSEGGSVGERLFGVFRRGVFGMVRRGAEVLPPCPRFRTPLP